MSASPAGAVPFIQTALTTGRFQAGEAAAHPAATPLAFAAMARDLRAPNAEQRAGKR